jgi:hypothetical protein
MNPASPHIKGHYTIIKIIPGELIVNGQLIDLRRIKLEQARKLYLDGFQYLKPTRKEKVILKTSNK